MRVIHRNRNGSIEIKYICKLKDNSTVTLSVDEIEEHERQDKLLVNGYSKSLELRSIKNNTKRKRDSFEPHHSFATGEWIGSKNELVEHNKRHGLDAEAGDFSGGSQYLAETRSKREKSKYITDESIEALKEAGLELSANEVDSLKEKEAKGELHKDVYIEKSEGSAYEEAKPAD